jgi:hypothetical protein
LESTNLADVSYMIIDGAALKYFDQLLTNNRSQSDDQAPSNDELPSYNYSEQSQSNDPGQSNNPAPSKDESPSNNYSEHSQSNNPGQSNDPAPFNGYFDQSLSNDQ